MNMQSIRRSAASLFLATAATVTSNGEAIDAKNHPGTLCVDNASPTAIRYGVSFAFNSSATTKLFLCPVVRDGGGGIDLWSMAVQRVGGVGLWQITIANTNEVGDTGNTMTVNVPNGNGVKTLGGNEVNNFGFITLGQTFIVSTAVPANARIHSYFVGEEDNFF